MERVEAVVIGAGQAGLCMSYHLSRLGIEHLVLERARIAERWRSERWDSLVFQFPNWMLRLPGFAYEGPRPDDFMPRDGIVEFLEEYARRTMPPVRCGVRVTGLYQSPSGHLRVEADSLSLEALHVVVATGPYQRPIVPALSQSLPAATWQITANCYTRAQQLPPGAVLVVGSGGSGWQIAEDLVRNGRRVYLSVGRHLRVPRRYRGQDFGWWQEALGTADQVVGNVPRSMPPPLLTGIDGGHDADLRDLQRRGATLLGSLGAVEGTRLRFVSDLEENLAKGDAGFEHFCRSVDAHVQRHHLAAPRAPAAPQATGPMERAVQPGVIDLAATGITSIIWAVGYQPDFGWIHCAPFNTHGHPVHSRGLSPTPGLYFLGLPRLHKVKSAFLWGVGEDAAYLASHILDRRRGV
ncbi:NAD(P)-binding domain-containing protein [Piscinibacter gummiphilus]|uniref:NAD(P)-binding domain-containing protein n=1 Tax=Piscinibacter gummiphilus TaxID=946333 RepID=A0ABZ0CZ12_9BURK|nr:NAD(P)-binding domain-containing protein [Piscinibacter gummiphilus]WOB10189.1 NAD(P)-binding domain-containing protein [Piscinibacter gummiphilus]